jgi:hypothetical protein
MKTQGTVMRRKYNVLYFTAVILLTLGFLIAGNIPVVAQTGSAVSVIPFKWFTQHR